MPEFEIVSKFKAERVRSLVWDGDELIDWAQGGIRFGLDSRVFPSSTYFAYAFDSACSSPSGKYSVIYKRLGTKGLLLKGHEVLREINRSYYHADVYEYPICFAKLNSGQEILIHCPNGYEEIDIEDVESGESLTSFQNREPSDFFHSRFLIDGSGRWLLSAGWFWHPFDTIRLFDIEKSIDDPRLLDDSDVFPVQLTEISSASFLDANRLVIASSNETFAKEQSNDKIPPSSICVWNIADSKIESQSSLSEPAGTLMPVNDQYVVGFFKEPKIISLASGEVIARLPGINTGEQTSSIIHHIEPLPPVALDPVNRRFAVASDTEITVVKVLV